VSNEKHSMIGAMSHHGNRQFTTIVWLSW